MLVEISYTIKYTEFKRLIEIIRIWNFLIYNVSNHLLMGDDSDEFKVNFHD